MADRVRAFDWANSPLGPIAGWPASLKAVVNTLLECQLPMYLAWGPQLVQIYNDAYRPILGDKDGAALGGYAPDTWREIWPTIGPMWKEVLEGKPIGFDDFKLTIERYGYPEDTYFNFSYSPVRDDAGHAVGVLVTFAETTQRVLHALRLNFLDELSQATRSLGEPAAVLQLTAEMLGRHLGANRCAYAQVHDDEDTFDLIGDFNDGVPSIVGRHRFGQFGEAVLRLMREDRPYVNPDVDADPQTAGTDLAAYRLTQIQAVICVPLKKEGRLVAAMAVHQKRPRRWSEGEIELVRSVVSRCWDALQLLRARSSQEEEARSLELLNRTGAALAAELDLSALLQRVTDAATELTGATFGAFFYNGIGDEGEAYLLYALSGAERSSFEGFDHPRPTPLFGPTFRGGPPIRLDDVTADERFGRWPPHHGMPPGHLPLRSYLAVPVVSRSGEVLGGLFFGHPDVAMFTERSERLAVGIAGQAAIAIDNARLYAKAQEAAEERSRLLESERSARQAAEQAGVLKDEFLATLSHELRTPLSAITGWVHILRRKVDRNEFPEITKGVDIIERSAKAQLQLIEDLLDTSRITSGKLILDVHPVSAAAFVHSAVDLVRPTAHSAGVQLSVTMDDVAVIQGDAGRLQQVVWNLLANAVKFTPRGGAVGVSVGLSDGMVDISVADTGIGISPEFLPHIFDRFRQADGSLTRRFGGLGLGLSIVKNVVELHGGRVRAESAGAGQGSRFVVSLPCMDLWTAPGKPTPEPVTEFSPQMLQGIRVLVVDDDAVIRDLLQRFLEGHGATVDLADGAEPALLAVRQGKVQVLLSDIGMPGMDGFSFLKRLRQLPADQGGAVPAIALTAFAREDDRIRAMDAGFTAHFTKPVNLPALAMRVRQLVA